MTVLQPHTRGDTFKYSNSLGAGWVGADFTGGFKFTLRTRIPVESSVADDSDSTVIDKGSVATGEIVFTGAAFVITIPKERTTLWPVRKLYWDLQGVVTANGYAKTMDSGTIEINGDVTRTY